MQLDIMMYADQHPGAICAVTHNTFSVNNDLLFMI